MGAHFFSMEGRIAVVVGGTSGIGRTLSLGLAEAGADVVATGRRVQYVNSVADEIEALGRQTLRKPTDLGDRTQVEALLEAAIMKFGKVDILVNCAGKTKKTPTLTLAEEDWRDVLETNVTGMLRTCQVFGRHMLERGYGRIINIASLTSFAALYESASYSASKAAVMSLTQTLAVEWSKHGVMVNALVPGVFRTDMNAEFLDGTPRGQEFKMRIPMDRFGQTRELVGATLYLASDSASYTSGHGLVVDGGFMASAVNR